MELVEIFQVLGIEQTKDERVIKNAYRAKLTVTNPEDNAEGFKRLRAAYEEACAYARRVEEEVSEKEISEKKEDSPVELWGKKAAEIYSRIDTRCDVKQWESLFSEDIFLSLEDEENCRLLLLRFIMDHYKLPTAVWELFDKKLNIVADAPRLREKFAADFVGYIVSKCERGEDVEFAQFEGAPDANYDLFLKYYDRCWHALNEENLEQAAEYIKNADELSIFHPIMEVCRATLLLKQDKPEEAVEMMKQLQERFPEDVMVCYNTGEILWNNGQKEEAAVVYESVKSIIEKHYMANVRLTEWYYECGRYEDAKKCAEEVLSSGADDNFMEILAKVNRELEKDMEAKFKEKKEWRTGLDLCWCYLQDGKVHKGIRLAKKLEQEIPAEKRAEYNGLMAKLSVEAAEYEEAIAISKIWEQSLIEKLKNDETEVEKDNDRIRQSHIISMQCHKYLGYADNKHFVEAIREADCIMTGTSKDIGLMLEKAQIYMEMEEYEKSLELSRQLIEEYQIYAAYATAMEVYCRQWDAKGVVHSGRQCIHIFPTYIRAYEHVAKVLLDFKQMDDLRALLEDARKNGIESVILDGYRYQMEHEVPDIKVLDEKIEQFRKEYLTNIEKGKLAYYEKGLPILTEYLYWYPGTYMLVERGIFHKAANHLEEAKEDFEKALSENPAQPYALNGLSFVYKFQGNYEKAIVCLKKAILYMGEDVNPVRFADLGNLYSLLGDYESALTSYRKYMKIASEKKRRNAYFIPDMAMCLARCGHINDAIEILKSVFGESFTFYSEAVHIYQISGKGELSQKLLEQWDKALLNCKNALRSSDYAKIYDKQAWQQLLYGSGEKAIQYFEKLLNVKSHDNSIGGSLCDMIFACILSGDEEKGKLYSAKLREWQKKEKEEGRNDYHNREKGRLQLDILAEFYTADEEKLEAMLAKEVDCQICHFCTFCICKELEAVRILYLLRKGEKEAALARLEHNLEIQPLDEYMLAIRHLYENVVRQENKHILDGVDMHAAAKDTESKIGLLGKVVGLLRKK